MRRSLAGARLILTGASGGIGRFLARLAAARGARLILAGRKREVLEEIAAPLQARGCDVATMAGDLTNAGDMQALMQMAKDRFGGLDVLINNAGVSSFGHFATSTEPILREIMEVNFFAPAELMRLAAPLLRRGNRPAIVNVSSMCARRGVPAWSEYSASKFALAGLTESLRAEFARFDIDVLLVVPGLTQTDFASHSLRRDGRMQIDFAGGMPPENVAASVLRGLERGKSEIVLGREARWLLRVNRFLPRLVDRLMARRVRALYAQEKTAMQTPMTV
jgi:short-subunit dehydrogenase